MRSFQNVAEQLVESHSDLTSEAVPKIACAADETKFWLTPSAQLRNPCFGPPAVYQDLSTHRRTGNFFARGAVNHLPKKFSQVAQIFTKP